MHIEGEPVIAYGYIKKNGDDNNVCYLSKERLFIRYKKRMTSFDNESIKGISFEHRLLLFPLVAGGIMTPLSIHALLHAYGDPWILLSLMVLGLLLMYYGWEGSSTMTIQTPIKDYDYFIHKPSANLKAFAEFVQHYISDDERARMFYFTMSKHEWANIRDGEMMNIKGPLRLSNWKEICQQKPEKDLIILGIDPVPSNIRIVMKQAGEVLQPVIEDNIPVEHIRVLSGQH